MKVSAWVNSSDLIPVKKSFLEKIVHLVLRGEKSKMFEEVPISKIFPALKDAGVDGLELLVQINTTDQNLGEIKVILQKYAIPVNSLHQSMDSFNNISMTEIERLCKIANLFSAKVITLHINALQQRIFSKDFIKTLKNLEKKYSVRFGIENLPKSIFSIKNSYSWRGNEFTDTIKDTELSITFDTTHLAQTGGDIAEFYRMNKYRIVNIHLSDFKKHWLNSVLLLQNGTHLALLDGELPIKEFLSLLKETKYSGLITMEINSNLKGLCKSAKLISIYKNA